LFCATTGFFDCKSVTYGGWVLGKWFHRERLGLWIWSDRLCRRPGIFEEVSPDFPRGFIAG